MALPIPRLDDVEFDALVAEGRGLIPELAPSWTDHNVSDPGITLLELLAWIIDQQVYQVGLVSDRHIHAFAALLGARARGPVPARGLLWPEPETTVLSAQEVPAGTTARPVSHQQIPCIVATDIYLTPARLSDIAFVTGGERIRLDQSIGTKAASFALEPGPRGECGVVELAFDRPLVEAGGVEPHGCLALGIATSPHAIAASGEPKRWGPLVIEYRTETLPWQRAEIVSDDTRALAQTGGVLLRVPSVREPRRSFLRLRLDRGFFPITLEIEKIALNVLPLLQVEKVPEGVIDRSNGFPDQSYELDARGLPDPDQTSRPLAISTIEEGTRLSWLRTEKLCRHGPRDRVYTLDARRNRVIFGNGVNGRIPPEDVQILHSQFHKTEGSRGNLVAGLRWQVDAVALAHPVYGTNFAPLSGGADGLDLERLRADTRERASRRDVLLTDDDLERAARELSGFAVARAEVLPRYHPAVPHHEVSGARTLVVVPWRRSGTASATVRSQYLDGLSDALAPRRLLGERLSVIAPRRVPVRVQAVLVMETGADAERVLAQAEAVLAARITDLPPEFAIPLTADIRPWPLGRPVTCAEIEGLLASLPRVSMVRGCRLAWDDQPFAEVDIDLARDEVAVGGRHQISVRAEDRG